MSSKFKIAQPDIKTKLRELGSNVMSKADLDIFLQQNRAGWNLPKNTTTKHFIELLIQNGDLKESKVGNTVLYTYGTYDNYELFLALRKNSFYSHFTAIRLHELTEQTPRDVYISASRINAPNTAVVLTQENIDVAFLKPPREKMPLAFENRKLFLISNVARDTQTITKQITDGKYEFSIRLTSLEKTMIDAVIRPHYCGGIPLVIDAFKEANEQDFSVNKALSFIHQNDYKYPYAQCLGFYLDKAGYKEAQLQLVERKIKPQYKLYLDHNIPTSQLALDERWQVYYPKDLF